MFCLYILCDNLVPLFQVVYNTADTSSSFCFFTDTSPMQSWHRVNNKVILSRAFSPYFCTAISNNQPSGIKPSKKGNMVCLVKTSARNGKVLLMASYCLFCK